MSPPFESIRIMLVIARFAFAALFLWASFGKIIDPENFAQQVANYQIIGPQASAIVGAILPWAEFVIGLCLLVGVCQAAAWAGTIVLFGCFAIARAYVLARGRSVECGCGVMDGMITPLSLLVSIVLCLTAVAAYFCTVRTRVHFLTLKCNEGPVNPNAKMVTLIALMMFVCSWSQNTASAASDTETQTVTAVRRASCRDMQSAFDRVVATDISQTERDAISRRLNAIDRVAAAVLHDLRLRHSAFVNQSLATVGDANERTGEAQPLIGAAKITKGYQSSFAGLIVPSELKRVDRDLVQRYLDTSSHALTAYIQSGGRACMSVVGVDGAEVVRLSFVLEMLTADQNQKLAESSLALPAWMRRPEALRTLQDFAAASDRPRIAFALGRQSTQTTSPGLETAYLSFVKQESDSLLRAANYKPAIVCLRDGIDVALASDDDAVAIALRLHLAEILEKTDSPKAAAEEMGLIKSIGTDADIYRRACVLRLKYLLEASDSESILKEVRLDVKDPRCAGSLPEIMYVAWLASRRQGTDAEPWRKRFLEQFPDHPLAAEMYYATALDAIAQNKTQEAARVLRFILDRFPQSFIVEKVHQIQTKLDTISGTSPN